MTDIKRFESISPVGIGTFNMQGHLHEIVQLAQNHEINLYDTSDDYGTEEELGSAIRKVYGGRNEFQIITKFTKPEKTYCVEKMLDISLNNIFGNIEESIDLLLLHWPYPFLYIEIWKKMIKLKEKGKTKHIGVCNFGVEQLQALKKRTGVFPEVNQIEVHPFFSQSRLCDYCQINNIRIMCYSPFGRGNKLILGNGSLADIAKKYNKTIPQIILKWDTQKGYIPIPACKSETHIKENSELYDFHISNEDMKAIDELDNGMRTRLDAKTFFSFKQKIKFFGLRLLLPIMNCDD